MDFSIKYIKDKLRRDTNIQREVKENVIIKIDREIKEKVIIKTIDREIKVYNTLQNFPKFINWNKNRSADNVRVEELKEYYIKNEIELIPGIIYTVILNNNLEVYDGIHRLQAAYELYKEKGKDFIIITSVLNTDDENIVISDFRGLNKSCPVPILYTEERCIYKKRVCESVIFELCKRYPTFVSPSRKPHQYNFNRDVTIEWLSEFNIEWTLKGLSDIILQELTGLNYVAKDFVIRNNINVPKKCNFNNFYLWYLDKEFIRKKIENAIVQYNNLLS